VNDGFHDAIKKYDDKDTSLDKAVDDFQKNVSITMFVLCVTVFINIITTINFLLFFKNIIKK